MILAVIQARMSSTRLPGKVLMNLHGKPMLQWVVEAAQGATLVDEVVVATSNTPADIPIVNWCHDHRVKVFRGSLDDVLDRFYQAALVYRPSHIVRLTGDCPLLEPRVIDRVIREHLYQRKAFTTNSGFSGSYPDGQDVEVFSYEMLLQAAKMATHPRNREHVTQYMHDYERLLVGQVPCNYPTTVSYSVDTQEEFERVEEVLQSTLNLRAYLETHSK